MSVDLSAERCEACHKDLPPVTETEFAELSALIPEWRIAEVDGVPLLTRTYRLRSWQSTMAFVARIGEIVDAERHHPRLEISYGRVTVQWWTHAIENLHRNDFIMAAKCDEAFEPFR